MAQSGFRKQSDDAKSAASESTESTTLGAPRSSASQQIQRSLSAWANRSVKADEEGEEAHDHSAAPAIAHTVNRKVFRSADAGADGDWRRTPESLQEQMAMDAARGGAGEVIITNLGDPRYAGMCKKEYKVTSAGRATVCVHYVWDPRTNHAMDFKFKETNRPPGIGRKAKD